MLGNAAFSILYCEYCGSVKIILLAGFARFRFVHWLEFERRLAYVGPVGPTCQSTPPIHSCKIFSPTERSEVPAPGACGGPAGKTSLLNILVFCSMINWGSL